MRTQVPDDGLEPTIDEGRGWLGERVYTTRGHLLATIVVGFALVGAAGWVLVSGARHDRAADRREAALFGYAAEQRAYDLELNAYTACTDQVASRLTLRSLFISGNATDAATIATINSAVPGGLDPDLFDALMAPIIADRERIDSEYPAFPPDHCPEIPPTPPTPPAGVATTAAALSALVES